MSRPEDYPHELPFLSDRGCLLSRSGAGESALFSVMWPASVTWPADLLRQPSESAVGARGVAIGELSLQGEGFAWEEFARRYEVFVDPLATLPTEVSTVFEVVCERSREAGWAHTGSLYQRGTAWFEKGRRVRLVTVTAAGVTLQEGLPEPAAAGA